MSVVQSGVRLAVGVVARDRSDAEMCDRVRVTVAVPVLPKRGFAVGVLISAVVSTMEVGEGKSSTMGVDSISHEAGSCFGFSVQIVPLLLLRCLRYILAKVC